MKHRGQDGLGREKEEFRALPQSVRFYKPAFLFLMCILTHTYHTTELSQNPSSDLHVSFLSSHHVFSKAETTYRMMCFYYRRTSLTSGAKGPDFSLQTIVSDPLDPILKFFPQKALSRDLSGDMFQEV